MTRLLRFGLVALVWLASLPALAREIVVGVEAIDYWPAYAARDGQYEGAAREIIDAFAQARGHTVLYRPFPINRLLAELMRGGVDAKFPDNPGWQADKRKGVAIVYSKPVMSYIDGTLVLPELADMDVDGVTSLGTLSGFTPFGWLDRIQAGKVAVRENPSFDQLLRQARAGRIDAIYVNVAVALNASERVLGAQGALVFTRKLPFSADSYRLSSVKSPEIIAEFDDWMARNAKLVSDILARTGAEKGVR
jgi:ABC-type amino acid transport substrate-binding protein